MRLSSGLESWASHLYTAPVVTPSTSASCSCVKALSLRNCRIFSASLIFIVFTPCTGFFRVLRVFIETCDISRFFDAFIVAVRELEMNTQINHFCELFLYHQYVKQTDRWIVSFIHQLTDVVIAVHFVFVIAGRPTRILRLPQHKRFLRFHP